MSDSQLFPVLDPAVEAALRESIRRFGVLVPIAVDQHNRMIDGHHRKQIADELGVKYAVNVHSVDDDDEYRELQRTLNLDRRQLDPEQRKRVEVALREDGHSLRAIAGAVGVSQVQVLEDLRTVKDLTVPDRTIGLDGKSRPSKRPQKPKPVVAAKNEKEAARAQEALGGISDLPATNVVDTKRIERIQREEAAATIRQQPIAPVSTHESIEIRHGDFREVLADLANVDAIITDPPYPAEYLDLYDDLSELAARILAPHGVLAVLVGQTHLPDYIRRLSTHMTYRWCGAYLTQGARTRVHQVKVGTAWKPVLIFQRPDATGPAFIKDDLFDSHGDDKQHHHWGQSESGIAAIVDQLATPGSLVVDPFLGGGTTAVVCRDLGRRFIGADIDAAAITTARERLA